MCLSLFISLSGGEIKIRQSPAIKGIPIGNTVCTVTQFADDSTCFLKDTASLSPLLDLLQDFSEWSGLKINRSKSMIILPHNKLIHPRILEGIPVITRAKILGIWFLQDNTELEQYLWNFKPQLNKIKSICDSWNMRNVSIKGKVTIVNSLLISLLQYQCSSIFTPAKVYKEYKNIITNFIWNGKKPKISYQTLILPTKQGGLNLMDLTTRVKVSTLQWIRRLVKNDESNAAASLRQLLGTQDLKTFLSYKRLTIPQNISRIKFYANLFSLWNSFHSIEPVIEGDIRGEILWNNRFITHKNLPLKWNNWEELGILTIQDLLHPTEGRFYSHTEITAKYGLKCTFLDTLSLRLSIPLHWRQTITPGGSPTYDPASISGIYIHLPGEEKRDIVITNAKAIYCSLISHSDHVSTAYLRWLDRDDDLQIHSPKEWEDINNRIYASTRETKLQALQYKTIHRITPCNQYLKQLRIKQVDECDSCGRVDSITHFFLDCPNTKSFMESICQWMEQVEDLPLRHISRKEFIFGVPTETPKAKIMNYILLATKSYIHRQKLFHGGQLCLLQWLGEFKTKLLVEEHICLRRGEGKKFNKWRNILRALG